MNLVNSVHVKNVQYSVFWAIFFYNSVHCSTFLKHKYYLINIQRVCVSIELHFVDNTLYIIYLQAQSEGLFIYFTSENVIIDKCNTLGESLFCWIVFFLYSRNHKVLQERDKHVTRFVAIAKVGNAEKQKVCKIRVQKRAINGTNISTNVSYIVKCTFSILPVLKSMLMQLQLSGIHCLLRLDLW